MANTYKSYFVDLTTTNKTLIYTVPALTTAIVKTIQLTNESVSINVQVYVTDTSANINNTNGYLGLAPRYDIRFITGYSNADYFIYFVTDFDNKSIRFNDLVDKQYYYSLKLVGGIRFDHPKVKVSKDKKQL